MAGAGRRWTVEESFQAGNGLAAPDEHQVLTRARRELAARMKVAEDAVYAAGVCGEELDELYDIEWTESLQPIPALLQQAQAALAGAGALARELAVES